MSVITSKSFSIEQNEFELMRKYIDSSCGIVVGDEKSYLIESRLAKLVAETGSESFREFYEILMTNRIPGLRDKVIDAITTNETLWFRDGYPFEILKKVILPDFAQRSRVGKYRIWSCGCSTGQEPYSLAMVIDRYAVLNPETDISLKNFDILATDISPSVLFLATTGRYDALSIKRGMDEIYLDRYFQQQGRVWTIREDIKEAITFKKFNLQDPFDNLGWFDIILCRNVIIYFSEEFKMRLFSNFSKVLSKDGYYFIGAAESVYGYTDIYDRVVTQDGVYYRLKKESK